MKIKFLKIAFSIFCILCFSSVGLSFSDEKNKSEDGKMVIALESTSFISSGFIPSKYTCDGENVSPPLKWSNPPVNTKCFALISDDPDAPSGDWVHWVIYNIPPGNRNLPENVRPDKKLPDGTLQGINDFGKTGYGGPCPPSGIHRYFFRIYALDTELKSDVQYTKKSLLKAMEGHVLGEGILLGKYKRK